VVAIILYDMRARVGEVTAGILNRIVTKSVQTSESLISDDKTTRTYLM